MTTIIGVRFRMAGKIYYFDPGEMEIVRGSKVIVETARGMEMGTVMVGNKQVEDEAVVQPLKPVIRMATEEDLRIAEINKEKEKEAFRICQEKIKKHELEMKLVDVEYTFDNNKILFYFTADGRIDFRELVKDLASVFKTRIELRQIGVRDETKILGGIGICGRTLCCHSYLSEFIPVSIKMAKEQNLSLNPTKISGVCGRLMCCLKNEEETYEYLNSRLPAQGDFVMHKGEGTKGTVHSVNVLRQTVKVIISLEGDDLEVREYSLDELTYRPRRKKSEGGKMTEAELRELEALEKEDLPEKKVHTEDLDDTGREGRSQGNDRSERNVRGDRRERSNRSNRGDHDDRGDRNDRTERNDSADRSDRRERGERNAPADDRRERAERSSRLGYRDHKDRDSANSSPERSSIEATERSEQGGRGDRRNRKERSRRSEREARPGQGERDEIQSADSRKTRAGRMNGDGRNARKVSAEEGGEAASAERFHSRERQNRRRRDRFRGRRGNDEPQNREEGENKRE